MTIDRTRRAWLQHGIGAALAAGLLPARVLGQVGPGGHDARPYVADAPARLAWVQQRLRELPPRRRWLLLGEQHDADAHQWLQAAVVQALSEQGRLGALVLEMAERGHDTAALPRHADEEAVRAALAWHDAGWPWQRYGPVVMAAVRAGVVVAGGNLPRREHGRVMAENAWDATLSDPHQRTALLRALDEGHCGLLPAAQLPAMARIQLARDDAMATTLLQQPHTDALVLLVTGAQHARRDRGVPHHLQRRLGPAATELVHAVELRATDAPQPEPDPAFDALWLTPAVAPRDPCAGLRSRR
ncbi:MAG: ChaN family lipoprotein [Tepidimonas sp.]|uniref:ChaN family lipoprotein n=1 Tax=Tepidimonas sp. TaxID=2002775 RepID=UPI00298F178D|nr:ChaN family lipoprotein [Tepidimonas sp.]MDW8335505.1 ChaN family lipoprotein [Tepidimonas sp.]